MSLRAMLPHLVEVYPQVDSGKRDRYGEVVVEDDGAGIVAADNFDTPNVVDVTGRTTPFGGLTYAAPIAPTAAAAINGKALAADPTGDAVQGAALTADHTDVTVQLRAVSDAQASVFAAGALDPLDTGVVLGPGGTTADPRPDLWQLRHYVGTVETVLASIPRNRIHDDILRLRIEAIAGPGVRITAVVDGTTYGPFDVTGVDGAALSGEVTLGALFVNDGLPGVDLVPQVRDLLVFGAGPAQVPARVEPTSSDEEEINRDQSTDRFTIFLLPETAAAIDHTDRIRWVDEDLFLDADGNARPIYGLKGIDHYELPANRIEG